MLAKILEVDPQKRSTLAEMFDDEWFSSIAECGLDENKDIYHGKGHVHTIVLEDDGKEVITDSTHFEKWYSIKNAITKIKKQQTKPIYMI